MTYDEREVEFLKELTTLTKKYRIEISGCGCCGSPRLECVENFNGHWEDKSTDIEEYSYKIEEHLEFRKVQT